MNIARRGGARRLRVLLSAYACEPDAGSEPGNGWNWARELSRYEDVWVLTRANNRQSIEKVLADKPLPNAHFVYVDLPSWAMFWKRGSRGLRLYYYLWQAHSFGKARRLHREVQFDLIHHVSFATYLFPSFLSLLHVPFVWGPVGGGETIPRDLARSFGLKRRIEEALRNIRRRVGESDPFVKWTARKATFVAATTAQTKARLAALGRPDAQVISHAALCDEDLHTLGRMPRRRAGPFRVLTVARMIPSKGYDLGVRAFAKLLSVHPESEHWIAGDGPERKHLEYLVRSLDIAEKVTFLGALSRSDVFASIEKCDVMLFPSLHESSGWATVEAMAAARPVICLDLGGPGMQINEDRGVKVPANTMEQIIDDLAIALLRLAGDPELCLRMGKAGRCYVQEQHNWRRLVRRFDDTYHRLLPSSEVRTIVNLSEQDSGAGGECTVPGVASELPDTPPIDLKRISAPH